MTLRVTFNEVIEAVRNECRLSSNTSRGIDHLEHIKQLIRRHYYTEAEDFDWQHLELKKETAISRKVLQAGSNTYDFPTAVNPLKITKAWVKHGGTWRPLEYGIKHSHYSALDPDANQRSDPVTNWAFYAGTCFEVWPKPASNGTADDDGEVAFEGQKLVERLITTASRLDMDDHLIVLLVSSEILAASEQKTAAEVKAGAAVTRRARLRASLASKTRYIMGRGKVDEPQRPRHPEYIR